MTNNENFYAYLAERVGDNKSVIEHFVAFLDHLYDECWNGLSFEDLEDYDFFNDVVCEADENDAYYHAYYNFADLYRNHSCGFERECNEVAAEYIRQRLSI